MEIPKKVRKQLDNIYEACDNSNYVIDYEGKYVPKKGDIFKIRHYHHIDQNRNNNEIWNLTPLTYNDHVVELHGKNNKIIKEKLYEFMTNLFPQHEEHYRKYLLESNYDKYEN